MLISRVMLSAGAEILEREGIRRGFERSIKKIVRISVSSYARSPCLGSLEIPCSAASLAERRVRCRLLSHVEEGEKKKRGKGQAKIKQGRSAVCFSSSLRIFDFAYPTPGER